MKKQDIVVGGTYVAKINNRLVTVRVDAIREVSEYYATSTQTRYDVTNLATGRKTTFRSAAKFRRAGRIEVAAKPVEMHPAGTTLPGSMMPLG